MITESATRLSELARRRGTLVSQIAVYQRWLDAENLADVQTEALLCGLRNKVHDNRLTVALVAGLPCGKSELVNAILFGDHGCRIVPASSGRTTMCPAEFLWDPTMEPCVRLLPIESRMQAAPLSELRRKPEEWRVIAIDADSPLTLAEALQALCETRRVSAETARRLGLAYCQNGHGKDEFDDVLIPRWRQAIINFPHPLLKNGLVILDTPGFNALGAAPELTLEVLPQADALFYFIALDTGVTRSDLALWHEVLSVRAGGGALRYAVLNKIDTIWDGLRGEADIQAEILQQRAQCAELLQIEASRIFPVSAQKGLIAKLNGDPALLDRSGLPLLERAISSDLLPRRGTILGDQARTQVVEQIQRTRALLEARRAGVEEQLAEQVALQGKNAGVVAHMMKRALEEQQAFESTMGRFQTLRNEMAGLASEVLAQLGVEALTEQTRHLLENALARQFKFTSTLRSAMRSYVDDCHIRLDKAGFLLADLQRLAATIYETLERDHGLHLGRPIEFSLLRHQHELERLAQVFEMKFQSMRTLVGSDERDKFFETIVRGTHRLFSLANHGIDHWLRAIIMPVAAQMREGERQIQRRVESIKRIRGDCDAIDVRIAELRTSENGISAKLAELSCMAEELGRVPETDSELVLAA